MYRHPSDGNSPPPPPMHPPQQQQQNYYSNQPLPTLPPLPQLPGGNGPPPGNHSAPPPPVIKPSFSAADYKSRASINPGSMIAPGLQNQPQQQQNQFSTGNGNNNYNQPQQPPPPMPFQIQQPPAPPQSPPPINQPPANNFARPSASMDQQQQQQFPYPANAQSFNGSSNGNPNPNGLMRPPMNQSPGSWAPSSNGVMLSGPPTGPPSGSSTPNHQQQQMNAQQSPFHPLNRIPRSRQDSVVSTSSSTEGFDPQRMRALLAAAVPGGPTIFSTAHTFTKLVFRAGFLRKFGSNSLTGLNSRYFKLHRDRLVYFKNDPATQAAGSIQLQTAVVQPEPDDTASSYRAPGHNGSVAANCCFSVTQKGRKYIFLAESGSDRSLWLDAITHSTEIEKRIRVSCGPDDANHILLEDSRVEIEGWLVKMSGGNNFLSKGEWQKRYCIYSRTNHTLYYFKDQPVPTGEIMLKNTDLIQWGTGKNEHSKRFMATELAGFSEDWIFSLFDQSKLLVFLCGTQEERDKWCTGISALQKSIAEQPPPIAASGMSQPPPNRMIPPAGPPPMAAFNSPPPQMGHQHRPSANTPFSAPSQPPSAISNRSSSFSPFPGPSSPPPSNSNFPPPNPMLQPPNNGMPPPGWTRGGSTSSTASYASTASASSMSSSLRPDSVIEELEDSDEESPEESRETSTRMSSEQLLQKGVQEFLETEESYVNSLKSMVNIYIARFRAMNKLQLPQLMSESEISQVFSNLEAIYDLNCRLYKELKDSNSQNRLVYDIGRCFRQYIPFFKLYKVYVKTYDTSQALLTQLSSKNKLLKNFLDVQAICEGKPLESSLIAPIQRVPRYVLLFDMCLKHAQDTQSSANLNNPNNSIRLSEDDIAGYRAALSEVKDVAENINTTVNLWDAKSKVVAIQAKLGNSAQIVSPGRYLIREGMLKKGFEKGFHMKGFESYVFFLFNDCIIYALKRQFSGTELQFKHSLLLTDMELKDIPDSVHFRNAFSMIVKHNKDGKRDLRTVTVWSDTPGEKSDWMNSIQNALSQNKNSINVGNIIIKQ